MSTEYILPSNSIKLGDLKITSISVNPASTAHEGNPGDVVFSSSTKKLYVKQDGGTSTSWNVTDLASLSGVISVTAAGVATLSSGLSGKYAKNLAVATYNFATLGGVAGDIALGVTIPSGAIITSAFVDIITQPTSGGSATVAIKAQSAGDILAATAKASLPVGLLDGVPDNTVANAIKCTAARELTATIGTANLTAGKFYVFVEYVQSSAT